ncbi:PREDICTED: uncharacterized protein LOC107074255 [Polistes dominula]|uniref:Uncharacterized protein LOC107074255 n=1 Tax=Polistes dominula TaxID=743375 RepID=A0ABM1JEV4_POLDO|nr:PREDICTED: uncharacterized protein LOC107074255 [Polistes dominula]
MIVHQEDRIKRTRDTNEVEIKQENETYQTIQAYFLLLIISIMCYQSFINGNLEYDIVENGETLYGSSPYQKRNGTFVRLTLGYPFNRVIIYTVTSIMLLYSLISKNPEWSFPMIVLYLLDLVCDVSYSILAIYLFFQKFHLSTASIYTIVTLLMIAGEIWAWLGVLQLYEYRTYK